MGRFERDEEDFPGQSALWAQAARNALRGKRGQAFLRELERALLAMPERRLCEGLASYEGEVCAIGQVYVQRQVDAGRARAEVIEAWLEESDDEGEEWETLELGEALGMAPSLAQNLAWQNDTCTVWHPPLWGRRHPTAEQRWDYMLRWTRRHLHDQGQAEGSVPTTAGRLK